MTYWEKSYRREKTQKSWVKKTTRAESLSGKIARQSLSNV